MQSPSPGARGNASGNQFRSLPCAQRARGLYSRKCRVGFTHTRVHTADRHLLLFFPPTPAGDTPQAPHHGPQASVSGSASAWRPQPNPQWISDRYAPLRARCLDGQAHTCPVRKHSEPGPLTCWGAARGRGRRGEAWSIPHPRGWNTPFRDRPCRSLLKGRRPPAAHPDADSTALPSDGTVQSPSGVKAGAWFSRSSLKDEDHQGRGRGAVKPDCWARPGFLSQEVCWRPETAHFLLYL